MIFAAKQTVDYWFYKRAERQREAARKQERERIMKVLKEQGVPLTAEQARALVGDGVNG